MEVDENVKGIWDHFVVGGWAYLAENPGALKSVGIIAAVFAFIIFASTRRKKS